MYTVIPSTYDHIEYVKSLEKNDEVDFWSDIRHLHESIDVMISPRLQKQFENELKSKSIAYNVMLDNVGR